MFDQARKKVLVLAAACFLAVAMASFISPVNATVTNTGLKLLNPSIGTQGCIAANQYTFQVNVTDTLGWSDVDTVYLSFDPSGLNLTVKCIAQGGYAQFSKVSDPNNYITLSGGNMTWPGTYNLVVIDFNIIFVYMYPDGNLHSCRVKSTSYYGTPADVDTYADIYYLQKIVPEGGFFRLDGSQLYFGVRLRYNGTASYITSKNVGWKAYSNGTQYQIGTTATNSSGWLNVHIMRNVPWRNGTWSMYVTDNQNATVANAITASYYIKTSGYNITSWPTATTLNSPFNFTVAFTNNAHINNTAIKLNLCYVTVEAWWWGTTYISTWTYSKFTSNEAATNRTEQFINSILEGNNIVRVRLWYYDNQTSHLLGSMNRTYNVAAGGNPSGSPSGSTGSTPSPDLGQQIGKQVTTNPLVQTGLIALTVIIVAVFVLSRSRKPKVPSVAQIQRKWKKRMEI